LGLRERLAAARLRGRPPPAARALRPHRHPQAGWRVVLALGGSDLLLDDGQQRPAQQRPHLHLQGGPLMSAACEVEALPVEQKAWFFALACPATSQPLRRQGDVLVTPDGKHSYPVVREVPRFVSSDHYTRSFSFEWNVHNSTQLDSHRSDGWSE